MPSNGANNDMIQGSKIYVVYTACWLLYIAVESVVEGHDVEKAVPLDPPFDSAQGSFIHCVTFETAAWEEVRQC